MSFVFFFSHWHISINPTSPFIHIKKKIIIKQIKVSVYLHPLLRKTCCSPVALHLNRSLYSVNWKENQNQNNKYLFQPLHKIISEKRLQCTLNNSYKTCSITFFYNKLITSLCHSNFINANKNRTWTCFQNPFVNLIFINFTYEVHLTDIYFLFSFSFFQIKILWSRWIHVISSFYTYNLKSHYTIWTKNIVSVVIW